MESMRIPVYAGLFVYLKWKNLILLHLFTFISEIEAVCRQWLASGPKNLVKKGVVPLGESKNLYKVKSELKYAMKNYCMEYYFEIGNAGKAADWNYALHDLQLSFGVKDFMVIAPQSANGVILDSPEASKLLSAVAIAFSNCSSFCVNSDTGTVYFVANVCSTA